MIEQPQEIHKSATITPAKVNGAYYTIIEFKKGTSKLSKKSKSELQDFISKTNGEGIKSKEIKIFTFPYVQIAKKKDSILADKRAMAIISFLRRNIKTNEELLPFNMANKHSALNAFLKSDDPQSKKVFEKTKKIISEGEDLSAFLDDQTQKALIIRDYE